MQICIFAPENSPSLGGVGSYVYNLTTHLPNSETIHIITINRKINDSYQKIIKQKNVHVHSVVDIGRKDDFFYNARLQLAILTKLKKLHKMFNFDIIHSHSGHLPHLYSQFLSIAPMVVTVHATVKGMKANIAQYKNLQANTERYMDIFSSYIELGEKIGFRKADFLLPVSNFTSKEISNLYKFDINNKSKVIYNATNTKIFKSSKKINFEKPTITFIGRFYAIKGFDKYLEAIQKMKLKGYDFTPFLVGRGDVENIRKPLQKNFAHFFLKDFVPYKDMNNQVYDKSDIVIVPSLYENFPGVVLEAMSSGKIVIASNVGGIPEVIEDGINGFLFRRDNTKDLIGKIKAVMDGKHDLSKIQANARKTILNNLDWPKKSEEICNIYERILEKK